MKEDLTEVVILLVRIIREHQEEIASLREQVRVLESGEDAIGYDPFIGAFEK